MELARLDEDEEARAGKLLLETVSVTMTTGKPPQSQVALNDIG
jgi:hypothetical protein